MSLLRFLGLGGKTAGHDQEPESLALLTGRLDSLPEEDARLAAAFALLLARVAGADLRTGADERDSMAERLAAFGQLEADQAKLLVETAVEALDTQGGTENHLVARAFRDMTKHEERLRLLRCLYAVAAADETITTDEDNEIFGIATAIGVERPDVIALRFQWKEFLGTMKALPRER